MLVLDLFLVVWSDGRAQLEGVRGQARVSFESPVEVIGGCDESSLR